MKRLATNKKGDYIDYKVAGGELTLAFYILGVKVEFRMKAKTARKLQKVLDDYLDDPETD